MADVANTPGAMPETTENGRDAQPAEREAEDGVVKALKAERKLREAAEKRLKALEDADKARAEKDALERGEFETLKKQYKAEVEAERKARVNLLKDIELRKIAEKFINPELIDEAIEKAAKQFEYENGALSGNQTPDEWFTELVKAKRVYAKQSQPGAMKGTMPSGGTAQPDFSKMNGVQKMNWARSQK